MQQPLPVTHYFLHDGKRQYGPFTYGQLCTMQIYRNALIWREGLPAWTPAGQLPELQSFPFAGASHPNEKKSYGDNSGCFSMPDFDLDIFPDLNGCFVGVVILAASIWLITPKCSDKRKPAEPKTAVAMAVLSGSVA